MSSSLFFLYLGPGCVLGWLSGWQKAMETIVSQLITEHPWGQHLWKEKAGCEQSQQRPQPTLWGTLELRSPFSELPISALTLEVGCPRDRCDLGQSSSLQPWVIPGGRLHWEPSVTNSPAPMVGGWVTVLVYNVVFTLGYIVIYFVFLHVILSLCNIQNVSLNMDVKPVFYCMGIM